MRGGIALGLGVWLKACPLQADSAVGQYRKMIDMAVIDVCENDFILQNRSREIVIWHYDVYIDYLARRSFLPR
ncbi:hypothetical protein SAMN05444158_0358 [Bradyrhizobium canariense]|uniref:Uncharacterized protein n=1 Tax=Bradyrhizobium canariense TaxID=255045 RepID=A0A1H1MU33_9BRAD|nr:hypothetical protein SAMN05444158_0358 [Bradyrhizobium canariense]